MAIFGNKKDDPKIRNHALLVVINATVDRIEALLKAVSPVVSKIRSVVLGLEADSATRYNAIKNQLDRIEAVVTPPPAHGGFTFHVLGIVPRTK